MATKKQKRTKELAHRMKMEEKKTDAIWFEGVKVGCSFALLMMKSCLSEKKYGFDEEKLGELMYDMNRRSIYMDEGILGYEDIYNDFDNKNIDAFSVGEKYLDKLQEIRDSIRQK